MTNLISWAKQSRDLTNTHRAIRRSGENRWDRTGRRNDAGQLAAQCQPDLPDPRDEETGEQLRRRAKKHGLLSATYLAGPFKGGIEFKAIGTRYDDPHWQTGMNMGGYALTNLFANYTLSKNWQAFARVDNVFDRNYDVARSVNVIYGTPGISAFAGIRYTFQ
jgi:vitamin B12 transporter